VPNPLRDELTPEAKAELAAIFAGLRREFQPMDVEFQRIVNRTWNSPQRRYWE
jgi:hypothetical protein